MTSASAAKDVFFAASGLSFAAFGIEREDGTFGGSDVIKIESNGPYCTVHDAWATDGGSIAYDYSIGGNDDLTDAHCTTSEGYIEATFLRFINTGDIADVPLNKNGFTDVFFLWNRSDIDATLETSEYVSNEESVRSRTCARSKWLSVDFFAADDSTARQESDDLSPEDPDLEATSPATAVPGGETSPDLSTTSSSFQGSVTVDEDTEYRIFYIVNEQDITFQLSFKGAFRHTSTLFVNKKQELDSSGLEFREPIKI